MADQQTEVTATEAPVTNPPVEAPKQEAQEAQITKYDEKWLEQNRTLGMEDMDEEDMLTPVFAIVQESSKYKDINGMPFKRGTFYYKAENTVYDEVEVVILTFTKKMLPGYEDKSEFEKNYIVMGAILPELKPFKWHIKATSVYPFKDFLTQVKVSKKPCFITKVKLTIEAKQNEKASSYVPKFNITGVVDQALYPALAGLTEKYGPILRNADARDLVEDAQVPENEPNTENVKPEDIPF